MCHQVILSPILVKAVRVNANNYILTDTIVYGSGSIVSSNVIMDWCGGLVCYYQLLMPQEHTLCWHLTTYHQDNMLIVASTLRTRP